MTEITIDKKHHLGLALGGGGAKGIAHLGVLKAMQESGLKPDIISGTSAGSMAAAFYADGSTAEEILGYFNNRKFREFAGFSFPQGGFIKTDRFRKFLEKHIKARTFEELPIPIVIVATDLERGKIVEFTSGDLISAIIASCAVPIVFQPVEIDGIHYVDGGVFKNFPVSTIRKKCEHLIGVNVAPIVKQEYKSSMMYVAERTYHYMSLANTLNDRKLCDILVESKDISKYTMFQLEGLEQIYAIGYESGVNTFKEKTELLEKIRKSSNRDE